MRLKYAVVFERSPNNYGAYVPDLPGCISTGDDWEHMQEMIKEAITFHKPLPEDVKQSLAEFGEVDDSDDPEFPPRFGMVEVEINVPETVEAV